MSSWHDIGEAPPLAAGADLSAKQYYIVKQTAQTYVLAAAATDPISGVLQNKPTAGLTCLVYNRGKVPVIAGGTVDVGDKVTTDGNAKAITTTTAGNVVIGICTKGGASGAIIEINMDMSRVPA